MKLQLSIKKIALLTGCRNAFFELCEDGRRDKKSLHRWLAEGDALHRGPPLHLHGDHPLHALLRFPPNPHTGDMEEEPRLYLLPLANERDAGAHGS